MIHVSYHERKLQEIVRICTLRGMEFQLDFVSDHFQFCRER